MKNYYDELEISNTASQEVIEKVYKVLAKKYHPDMHQGDDKLAAEEKFKKVSEAYEVLSNPEKRKKYDLELEQSNPKISYEDYMSVVNERNNLNNDLNHVKNQFSQFKNSNSGHYQNSNNTNSQNIYNQTNYQNSRTNYNNIDNSTPKYKYYYTNSGKPASAFDYFKYRIKNFFSNVMLVLLLILTIILVINAFAPFNIFSLFIK